MKCRISKSTSLFTKTYFQFLLSNLNLVTPDAQEKIDNVHKVHFLIRKENLWSWPLGNFVFPTREDVIKIYAIRVWFLTVWLGRYRIDYSIRRLVKQEAIWLIAWLSQRLRVELLEESAEAAAVLGRWKILA